MKKISSLKVVKFFAWFGVVMALSMLGKSVNHYQALGVSLIYIDALTPIERDMPTEIVMSLAAGRKDADLLIKLAGTSHENNKRLHDSWLKSVELHRSEAFFLIFIWAVVLIFFIAIAISAARHRSEL